jgi:large subunit ribosomal protein L10
MTKEQKTELIAELSEKLASSNVFYLADTSELSAEVTQMLRRECFNKQVGLRVVKNTLLRKALERIEGNDYSEIYGALSGHTAVLFSEVGNAPAKLIQEFRRKHAKPILKAAYVEQAIYVGDEQLDALVAIKSREELIGDIVGLLQSPARNVISALQSGGSTIAGVVKTLSER